MSGFWRFFWRWGAAPYTTPPSGPTRLLGTVDATPRTLGALSGAPRSLGTIDGAPRSLGVIA